MEHTGPERRINCRFDGRPSMTIGSKGNARVVGVSGKFRVGH